MLAAGSKASGSLALVQAILAGDCLYFGFRCEEPELDKIDAGREPMIHTVRGAGYMLKAAG